MFNKILYSCCFDYINLPLMVLSSIKATAPPTNMLVLSRTVKMLSTVSLPTKKIRQIYYIKGVFVTKQHWLQNTFHGVKNKTAPICLVFRLFVSKMSLSRSTCVFKILFFWCLYEYRFEHVGQYGVKRISN